MRRVSCHSVTLSAHKCTSELQTELDQIAPVSDKEQQPALFPFSVTHSGPEAKFAKELLHLCNARADRTKGLLKKKKIKRANKD